MAKITRFTLKPFGSNGPTGDFGQFGSLATSTPTYTKDPATIQSLAAWLNGWQDETIANNRPALEDFNSIDFLYGQALCYMFQQGIPEYDAGTVYYTNSFCTYAGILYKSLTDANLNNQPDISTTRWAVYTTSSYSQGMIMMWGGLISTIPTGWHLCNGATYNGYTTPDLRDRFVICATADSGGVAKTNVTGSYTQTGGVATVTLDITTMPNHNHTTNHAGGAGGGIAFAQGQGGAGYYSTNFTGGGLPHDNLPPYYALAYICYTG